MSEPLEVGATLGRYCIESDLGKGRTGMVYLARDTALDVQVALKVLDIESEHAEEGLGRFKRELILGRRVAHPGICRVFDLHQEGNVYFISMEYVAGETLRALLYREGILELGPAVHLLRRICRALRVAHRVGIIHRDLKPSNIIIATDGSPSIIDFGFAKGPNVGELTQVNHVVGTPQYLAPEVLEGKQATQSSDTYSIGIILYRCVTGRLPFNGRSVQEVARAVRGSKSTPPSQFNGHIDAAFDAVILRAIAPLVVDRYQDLDSLEKALGDLGLDATDVNVDEGTLTPWNKDIERTITEVTVERSQASETRSHMRQTTILFSDIAGITPYFDHYGDIAGRHLLLAHNRLLFPVIQDHSGIVIKTIGDAIMASFDRGDDAVEAAIEMQRVLSIHNAGANDRDAIRIRIGMHSGKAIVEREDVFGNTVNVAARVSAKAQPRQILISSDTRDLLADSSVAVLHESTELKGKPGTFDLFAVHWGEETVKTERTATDAKGVALQDADPLAWIDSKTEPVPGAYAEEAVLDPADPALAQDNPAVRALSETVTAQVSGAAGDSSYGISKYAETHIVSRGVRGNRDTVPATAVLSSSARFSLSAEANRPWIIGGGVIALALVIVVAFALGAGEDEPTTSPADGGDRRGERIARLDDQGVEPTKVVLPVAPATAINPIPAPPSPTPTPELARSDADANPSVPVLVEETERPSGRDTKAAPRRHDTRSAALAEANGQRRRLQQLLRQRGIIAGDSTALDRARAQADGQLRRQRAHEASETYQRATKLAENLVLDKQFITAKLTRFNKKLAAKTGGASRDRMRPLFEAIAKAFNKNDYATANKKLNRGFAELENE